MTKTIRVFEHGSVFTDFILDKTPQNVIRGNGFADLGVIINGYEGMCKGKFGILLKPDNFVCSCIAGDIVTYGMSPYDEITLSSVGEEKCVMTIQRELITVFGEILEPQEIIIPRRHLSPYDAMAAAAALLIGGADIKQIF